MMGVWDELLSLKSMTTVSMKHAVPRSASGLSFPLDALKGLCGLVIEKRAERRDLKVQSC